jgi:FAD dependent oxidoreductase TIGR03364
MMMVMFNSPPDRERLEVDLCVVGAGIVGLAHAHEARRRGLSVALLDRHDRAVGASVRNFGHAFFTGVADEDLDCALRSRERWLELGQRAGLHVRRAGTLVVARAQDELDVIRGVAADPDRKVQVLTAEAAGRLAPIATDDLIGAVHCSLDVRIDPRRAVASLARLLEEDQDAHVRWGETVCEVAPGAVITDRVAVRAPAIVLAPGPDFSTLPAPARAGLSELTLCKLQMLRVLAPHGRTVAPGLATGLSLIRYPAFTGQPAAEELRLRLTAQRPELINAGIHLLVTQLPGGDLVIGDTHEYSSTPSPFASEQLNELLLEEARVLFGVEELLVRERWVGIYPVLAGAASPADGHLLVTDPLEGVRVVEVISGLGMTMAFGKAAAVLDGLGLAVAR